MDKTAEPQCQRGKARSYLTSTDRLSSQSDRLDGCFVKGVYTTSLVIQTTQCLSKLLLMIINLVGCLNACRGFYIPSTVLNTPFRFIKKKKHARRVNIVRVKQDL